MNLDICLYFLSVFLSAHLTTTLPPCAYANAMPKKTVNDTRSQVKSRKCWPQGAEAISYAQEQPST